MSDFSGMEEMLQDFLTEASDLLSSVDNNLVELEKRPEDKNLLNEIFRGFHTIKGGAGFLNATELVKLCHRTENLFDKLRNAEITLDPFIMDAIMAATGVVREMFEELSREVKPSPADPALLASLDAVLSGEVLQKEEVTPPIETIPSPIMSPPPASTDLDWTRLFETLTGIDSKPVPSVAAIAATAAPKATVAAPPVVAPVPARAAGPASAAVATKDTTIRVDTTRLDQVLNLSGEIGLTKNRLTCLRTAIMQGSIDQETIKGLDEAVSHLDLLVGDLQSAVMKTRMQPIGRLFQKYPRLARDVARQLGKDVELVLTGEETEIDKTMIEDLNDPLVHLIRNAVDHGVDSPEERAAAGKPAKSLVYLSAEQVGDHIIIEIIDDGRGIQADVIRKKALEKGLIDLETANSLDDKQSLNLIFMAGFTTKEQLSEA